MTDPEKPEPEPFADPSHADEMNVARVHGSIMREREDPSDGYEPVPLWLVTLFMGIVFWAGMYLSFYSGGFRADVYNPKQVSWEGGSAEPAGPPDPMLVGRRLYTANCLACHQATGLGVGGQFPPLVESEWVVPSGWHGDNHLVKILLHGLQGPIQVKGETYNNAMPPWDHLSNDQIASILTYIRNEWGNQAPPITAEYVAIVRENTTGRSEPWTQTELQAIPAELIGEVAPAPATGAPEDGPETPDATPDPDATAKLAPEPPPGA